MTLNTDYMSGFLRDHILGSLESTPWVCFLWLEDPVNHGGKADKSLSPIQHSDGGYTEERIIKIDY